MKNAETENLTERRDRPILFVGTGPNLPERQILTGDNVILKKDDESIQVKSVKAQSDGTFTGVIYGFQPSFGTEFEGEGLKLDDTIAFQEKHVFSCERK